MQNFLWFKLHGETQLLLANNNQNVTIVSATGSSILTLKNIADHDEGYYICDATANVAQPNQARVYLQLTSEFNCSIHSPVHQPIHPSFCFIPSSVVVNQRPYT